MSNEGRICPQCGYERQPRDLTPDYECPRCGIIYRKYRPTEPKSSPAAVADAEGGKPPAPGQVKGPAPEENRTDTGTPEEEAQWELRPASALRRALAGIYTGSRVILYFVPVKLLLYVAFRITHSPESINSLADIEKLRTWEDAYYVYLVLLIAYAFFICPFLDGTTWGQEKFGLAVRPRDDQEGSLTFRHYVLRFAGNLVALCTWPVTLAGLLYDLAAKRNDPGIADRISSTRQYETGEPLRLRQAVNKAFMPACIALILQFALVGPLSLLIMKGYFERSRQSLQQSLEKAQTALPQQMQQIRMGQAGHTEEPAEGPPKSEVQARPAPTPQAPEAKAAPGPAEAQDRTTERRLLAVRQNGISIISAMEKRQLHDRGSYTEDLEALVEQYGANTNDSIELLNLIRQGTFRARKTTQGVEIWIQTTSGDWEYEEVRR